MGQRTTAPANKLDNLTTGEMSNTAGKHITTNPSSTTQYLNDFDLDFSRSLKLKSNGALDSPYMASY